VVAAGYSVLRERENNVWLVVATGRNVMIEKETNVWLVVVASRRVLRERETIFGHVCCCSHLGSSTFVCAVGH
jgi:hypothetical protein